ncbi:MAG: PhnD/SsuA/transferrin family substrate-binding protein [Gammaproteobacteria bacterium]|nr:PhnD/SsuA/transferrin family substrate-binding protein [Gammaproteobacteria bacterium]MBU1969929.1 PhnD/SsuA/transferrin family substrate-binding protein [Gammaproteobacteria bacterium]
MIILPICSPAAETTVRIGVLSYRELDGVLFNWAEIQTKLAEAIPGYKFELSPMDGSHLHDAVSKGELGFVLTNSTQYVSLASDFGIQRIATIILPEAASPQKALGSTVLTLAGRKDVNNLSDLRGKRVAIVANDAFGGYLAAARELLGAGVDLEAGDADLVYVGFPMSLAIDALSSNQADVAIVRTCLYEHLAKQGKLRLADFKVVSPRPEPGFKCIPSTQLYPDWPLAAARDMDLDLAKKVAVTLLSMPPSVRGLSWSIPADYQTILELDRDLMIGPYAELRTSSFRGIIKNYRAYLLAALLVLVGVAVYFIRVQILVKRRTIELRESRAKAYELQIKTEHMARLSILGEMASTLAHELNQPLATIAAYAQGLERNCASGQVNTDMVSKVNHEIVAQTERADKVIRQVRTFARKRMAASELRPIADTVKEAIDNFSKMLPALPPVTLDTRLPPGKMLKADHQQIQQVLTNLMKNAADAMITLPAENRMIDIVLNQTGNDLTIAVADRGPQVPPETLAHLFEPFFTNKPDGLGLGLAICKSIAEAHSGKLSVHPRDPQPGLVFQLSLPEYRNDE